jgi:hypothetical protein
MADFEKKVNELKKMGGDAGAPIDAGPIGPDLAPVDISLITKKRDRGRRGGGAARGPSTQDQLLDAPIRSRGLDLFDTDPLEVDLSDLDGNKVLREMERQKEEELWLQMVYKEKEMEIIRAASDEKKRLAKEERDARLDAMQDTLSVTSDVFGNIANTIGDSSEKSFKAQKAFLIPAAIMEGIMSAMAGFRSVMQSVPAPANMILAPAYAASIAAATAVQVRNIAKQKYGGGKASASNGAVRPNFSAGSLGGGGGEEGDLTVNVIVSGQTIHQDIIKQNDIASQNGQRSFTTGPN